MSYDLAVWKRSATTKTAMVAEVVDAMGRDEAHPAMARFDMKAFTRAIDAVFTGNAQVNRDNPVAPDNSVDYEIADFTGIPANWVIFYLPHSQIAADIRKIVEVAVSQGLIVYDPQREVMWANKRAPKAGR